MMRLEEVKKLQKIAGILKENINEAPIMHQVDMDWENGLKTLDLLTQKYGLSYEVLEDEEQTGGVPYVNILGPKEKLIDFLTNEYTHGDAQSQIDRIQPDPFARYKK